MIAHISPIHRNDAQMTATRPPWTGEQGLCAALIEDALKVLRATSGVHIYQAQIARAEERAWFQSVRVEFGSYEYCAQHLHLDVEKLRAAALRL